jgi:hypothetical protein
LTFGRLQTWPTNLKTGGQICCHEKCRRHQRQRGVAACLTPKRLILKDHTYERLHNNVDFTPTIDIVDYAVIIHA